MIQVLFGFELFHLFLPSVKYTKIQCWNYHIVPDAIYIVTGDIAVPIDIFNKKEGVL